MNAVIAEQAGSLVRRARAGDQNAAGLLYEIGEAARARRNPRAIEAFTAVQAYIAQDPAEEYSLTHGKPVVMDTGDMVPSQPYRPQIRVDPELRKPPLPRGALDGVLDPSSAAKTILAAFPYRHGIHGAAVALASGPLLTDKFVKSFAQTSFGSEEALRAYNYGVQFCGEGELQKVGPTLDLPGQKGLIIGTCIGRARKIQMARHPRMPLKAIHPVVGWELGE